MTLCKNILCRKPTSNNSYCSCACSNASKRRLDSPVYKAPKRITTITEEEIANYKEDYRHVPRGLNALRKASTISNNVTKSSKPITEELKIIYKRY